MIITYRHIYTLKQKCYSLSSEKSFGSTDITEKRWKLSGCSNVIFLEDILEALFLESCFFMRLNNSFAEGIKSARHRVQQAVLKNSPLIVE